MTTQEFVKPLPMSGAAAAETDFAELRRREFARLDASGLTYLDYTGAALYPASLIRADSERLLAGIAGNPHSDSAPSIVSSSAVDTARRLTLQFLDGDPDEYEIVFTPNATGAMRILAEAFPFRRGSSLTLTADNHNSVNGLRLPAKRRGADVRYIPLDGALRSLDSTQWLPRAAAPSLFAFPAQSNFSGVQHPLDWIDTAQRLGYHVLLDAAAFVPTSPLSLSRVHPDFVAVSFYKMFGYPTGVGALIARREALAKLRRRYFGGGTVEFVSVQNRMSRIKAGAEGFEDGTVNFLGLPAVADGLRWLSSIGLDRVRQRVGEMTAALLDRLTDLRDRVEIYGPREGARGGIVAFNVRGPDGQIFHYTEVEDFARQRGIAIRGGCFCNPGAAEHALTIPADRARACLSKWHSISKFRKCLGNAPVGAVRASVGIPTTVADLDRLAAMIVLFSELWPRVRG